LLFFQASHVFPGGGRVLPYRCYTTAIVAVITS
jgi:hypothetical protein